MQAICIIFSTPAFRFLEKQRLDFFRIAGSLPRVAVDVRQFQSTNGAGRQKETPKSDGSEGDVYRLYDVVPMHGDLIIVEYGLRQYLTAGLSHASQEQHFGKSQGSGCVYHSSP